MDEGRTPLGFVGYIDDDTYVTTETFDVCLRATAAWIRAVDMAMMTTTSTDGSLREFDSFFQSEQQTITTTGQTTTATNTRHGSDSAARSPCYQTPRKWFLSL
jgi:hypothetical protein